MTCFVRQKSEGGFALQTKRWLSALLAVVMAAVLIPSAAFAEQAGTNGSSVVTVQDTETWYGDETKKYDTLTTYWNDTVTERPAGYVADDTVKTVSIGSAEALVWWSKLVNAGTSFAGYTVSLAGNIDLSAHYWTPICTGTVSYSADGKFSIANNAALEGTVIDGNGYTITGLTTQTGVRGPNQGSQPGDGQNCYYYSAFIGYNCCNTTIRNLTFDGARVAVSEPFTEVTQTYGSSTVAVVVGGQVGGSLTLNNVAVRNASTLAMQKTAAFVGNLMSGAQFTVEQCEVSNSTFSAYFMAAPILGYGNSSNIDVNGIRLSGNTVQAVQQAGMNYTVDPVTGAQYWDGELNASTTMVCSDGSSAAGTGTVLDLAAEVDGYTYPTLAEAVEAVVNSADKTGTVTLLKDSSGSGIGLFNAKGAVDVNLTIDFGGHTYTCTDPAVGSSGTESQGFHLEKGNTVTLKNGIITVAESSQKTVMLIQNYCDLTLEDLSLNGAAVTQYIISSNYGDMVLNRVNIDGANSNLVALDVMHWLGTGYAEKAPTMEIHNTETNTIRGKIDVYCYGTGSDACTEKPSLTIFGGAFTADPTNYLAPNSSVRYDEAAGQYVVHGHTLTETAAKDATCDEDGNIAYWYCAGCGKYFSDAAATKEISQADTVIPALGHNYQDGVCTNCGAEITVDVPTIDTSKPVESVQVAVDAANQTAINSEVDSIVEAVEANASTSAVDAATAQALRAAIDDGRDITVAVEFDNAIQASDAEKNLVSGVIGSNGSIQSFFDLSIVLKADGVEIGTITQLSKPMTFTVAVPASMIQEGKELCVVRIHNGVAERLTTVLNADNTLTFQTDKFSTYAIALLDPNAPQTPDGGQTGGTVGSTPQTGDSGMPAVWSMLLLGACAGAAVVWNRRKNRGC